MIVEQIFTQGKGGKIIGFDINGHANTAPHGYDIYCAGISSLSQSAFLCIQKHLKKDFDGDFSDGHLKMKLKTPPDELTEAVFQTMLIGIKEIANIGPKIVKVKITPTDL